MAPIPCALAAGPAGLVRMPVVHLASYTARHRAARAGVRPCRANVSRGGGFGVAGDDDDVLGGLPGVEDDLEFDGAPLFESMPPAEAGSPHQRAAAPSRGTSPSTPRPPQTPLWIPWDWMTT